MLFVVIPVIAANLHKKIVESKKMMELVTELSFMTLKSVENDGILAKRKKVYKKNERT